MKNITLIVSLCVIGSINTLYPMKRSNDTLESPTFNNSYSNNNFPYPTHNHPLTLTPNANTYVQAEVMEPYQAPINVYDTEPAICDEETAAHILVTMALERGIFAEKTFVQNNAIPRNMQTPKAKTVYACTLCGKSLASKRGLTYHIQSHTKEKPFGCSLCDKSFTRKGSVDRHMIKHRG